MTIITAEVKCRVVLHVYEDGVGKAVIKKLVNGNLNEFASLLVNTTFEPRSRQFALDLDRIAVIDGPGEG